jgi:hypothetical protein
VGGTAFCCCYVIWATSVCVTTNRIYLEICSYLIGINIGTNPTNQFPKPITLSNIQFLWLLLTHFNFSALPLFSIRLNRYIVILILAEDDKFWRCLQGKCLTKNQKSPSYLYAMLDWLGARIIATILFPIHMLAKKLVYSKIHSAIGFSKVLYSLLCFVVKFNIFVLSSLWWAILTQCLWLRK